MVTSKQPETLCTARGLLGTWGLGTARSLEGINGVVNKWGRGKNYKIETFTDVASVLFSCATERSPSDLRIAGETFQSRVRSQFAGHV